MVTVCKNFGDDVSTLGLKVSQKGAFRGLGLGGLHPVPGTNLCRDWVDST